LIKIAINLNNFRKVIIKKKKLTNYQKCLKAYREICCETCVKFLNLKYENYMFYETKPAKY